MQDQAFSECRASVSKLRVLRQIRAVQLLRCRHRQYPKFSHTLEDRDSRRRRRAHFARRRPLPD
jgi:hypothetical protein